MYEFILLTMCVIPTFSPSFHITEKRVLSMKPKLTCRKVGLCVSTLAAIPFLHKKLLNYIGLVSAPCNTEICVMIEDWFLKRCQLFEFFLFYKPVISFELACIKHHVQFYFFHVLVIVKQVNTTKCK
jgi:hypothetical protein